MKDLQGQYSRVNLRSKRALPFSTKWNRPAAGGEGEGANLQLVLQDFQASMLCLPPVRATLNCYLWTCTKAVPKIQVKVSWAHT